MTQNDSMSAEKINERIKEIGEQIKQYEDMIDALADEKYDLERHLSDLEKNDETQAFINRIYDLNKGNSTRVLLFGDTKTMPIMDEYYHSDKQFLVFERAIRFPKIYKPFSLVVVRYNGYCGRCNHNGLTMTDLKKHSGMLVYEAALDKGSRLYGLKCELLVIEDEVSGSSRIIPFHTPCFLGAQIYSNRTGYGSVYHGEDLVRQGTEYGETTGFLIIGIASEDVLI